MHALCAYVRDINRSRPNTSKIFKPHNHWHSPPSDVEERTIPSALLWTSLLGALEDGGCRRSICSFSFSSASARVAARSSWYWQADSGVPHGSCFFASRTSVSKGPCTKKAPLHLSNVTQHLDASRNSSLIVILARRSSAEKYPKTQAMDSASKAIEICLPLFAMVTTAVCVEPGATSNNTFITFRLWMASLSFFVNPPVAWPSFEYLLVVPTVENL